MTDRRDAADLPVDPVDASGEPLGDGLSLPEQPPMDDAAGGPQADSDIDHVSTDDLGVQGGE